MSADNDFQARLAEIYKPDTLPDELSGRYRISSCLHHTDTKQVYAAESIPSGTKYILKCASGELAERCRKEYEILEKLNGVIRCPKPEEFAEIDGKCFLVREYIEGELLSDIVEREPLSERRTFEIIQKLSEKIKKLHSLSSPVIIRDIKPQNIVISGGECIIIDFDAAREYDEQQTSDTEYMGTKATAAPEQFGYGQTDTRTDVYALGMLMTYMLAGDYDVEKITQKNSRRIVRKCTKFSPSGRYKSVSAVTRAIKLCAAGPIVKAVTVLAAAAAIAVISVPAYKLIIYYSIRSGKIMSPDNQYTYTSQANSYNDPMVSAALSNIDRQEDSTVRGGRTKREMIEFLLKGSDYAVFGGKEWCGIATKNEMEYISKVTDQKLFELDGTEKVILDTNSSGSMSYGWFASGVVYTNPVSTLSYRLYPDGTAGEYSADEIRSYFGRHLQAGEHIRVDETRSMCFISCDDDGFYFMEYGSTDNSDHHIRLRYFTFEDYAEYLNNVNKQMWYYEIVETENP